MASMLVKYIPDEYPTFGFYPSDVPENYYRIYGEGDDMFDYLNSVLSPADIDSVIVDTDGISCRLVIIFKLSEDVINGMPCFDPIVDCDDMPF